MLNISRYSIKTECLMPWIKFIWYLEADEADIHNKLLPTDCVDIILNLSGTMVYETYSKSISATPFHINGLRNKHSYIHQTGNIRVFGISLQPFGLYPFIHQSLVSMNDKIVDLYELSVSLARRLEFAVSDSVNTEIIVNNLENALCMELKVKNNYLNQVSLMYDFLEDDCNPTIQSFCLEHAIHPKTFMRNFQRFTGYTPKILRCIRRFQKVGNQLIHHNTNKLSCLAYDNGFADQSHFVRDFRRFSGTAPRDFLQNKDTIKQNASYIYR